MIRIPGQAASHRREGVTRQILRVYVLQMLFISCITVLGVFIAAKVVEGVMMRAALEGEAEHFWNLLANDSSQPLPDTDNLTGFLSVGGDMSGVPQSLRSLAPGYGRATMGNRNPVVFVQERYGNRLYLVFDEESVSRLSFFFGVVPLSLALVILYISAWFAYRQSRKAVSPIVQLARTMQEFDIDTQNLDDLKLDQMDVDATNEEVDTLIDALRSFTREIERMLERERRFTRDASHELRTPLTVIQGSTEWLATTSLNDRQRENIDRILRTTGDMNELVNALLLLARGTKKGLRTETVSVTEQLERILEQLNITHNADGHVSVIKEIEGDPQLICSPQGFSMVFSNLLRNAFNYTDQGEVRVVASSGGISVTNKGEGMKKLSAAEIEQLFEPFERGQHATPSAGHGIGLDIVRRLCDHFGWRISASYSVENGMNFDVRFFNR